MNRIRFISIIIILLMNSFMAQAQNVIKGYVTDISTDLPVEGAVIIPMVEKIDYFSSDSVFIKKPDVNENRRSAVSDSDGYFEIIPENEITGLMIYHVGYEWKIYQAEFRGSVLRIPLVEKAQRLDEVVIRGFNNTRKLKDTPGAISLISKKEIQRDNQTILMPALNRVPGVFMQSGALNTNRITIRGIGARSPFATQKIRAYLNDIPLTTGVGESTIEDIDMSLINRVEILKGPSSSIYGAGLGGTINLSVEKAALDQNVVGTEITTGSYGLIRSVTNYKYQDQSTSLHVNFNTTHSDGFRDNNEYDRTSLNIINQYYQGNQGVITLIGNYIKLKAFIPSSIDSATFATDPTSAAFTWGNARGFEDYNKGLFGVSYQNQYESGFNMSHSVFYAFRNAMERRPNPLGNLFETSNSIGFRSRLGFKTGHSHFQLGTEIFNEHFDSRGFVNDDGANGTRLYDNQEQRWYINVFGQWDMDITSSTFLTVGVNLNQTNYDLTDLFAPDSVDLSGSYEFDVIFSPRIALLQKINKNLNLYASVSHGFSPPTLEETLTPDGAFNFDIQPELGYNYEIGARGDLLEGKFIYDLSLYTMDINDLIITQRNAADQPIFVNAGKTSHNGLEALARYNLTQGKLNISFWGTYSLYKYEFDEFIDDDQDFSGNELTGVPAQVANLGADLDFNQKWYGNVTWLFTDEMPMRDDNSVYSEAYNVFRLKAGYRSALGKYFDIDLSLGIDNLFDEKYASMININAGSFGGNPPRYFYPGLPRNYFGSLKLSYNFGGK